MCNFFAKSLIMIPVKQGGILTAAISRSYLKVLIKRVTNTSQVFRTSLHKNFKEKTSFICSPQHIYRVPSNDFRNYIHLNCIHTTTVTIVLIQRPKSP